MAKTCRECRLRERACEFHSLQKLSGRKKPFDACEFFSPRVLRSKEWNISFSRHDGYGGRDEYYIILPSWWKVLWWFLHHARSCCDINIWTSGRTEDSNKYGNDKTNNELGV